MNNQSYEITVDTRKSISHSNIEFSQNNLNISELIFNITEDGTNFTLNDTDKIIVYFEKPDKTVVFQDKEVELLDKEKGKIKVLLTSQTLVKAGDVKGQISIERIEDGTRKRVNTYDFSFKVRSSIASNDSIESTNEFPMFDKALEVGEKFKDVDINGIIAAGELAKGALPKTGGTMTGNIDMDISVGSKSKGYRWRDATGALFGLESATDGNLILFDYKNGGRVFQFDPTSRRFTVLSDTNLVKTTGGTMTGGLTLPVLNTNTKEPIKMKTPGKLSWLINTEFDAPVFLPSTQPDGEVWDWANQINIKNLVKRTGDTMTGTLGIERGSAEMAVVFKKAGVDTAKLLDNDTLTALYCNDTKETIWRYAKATKTFDVVASNTNLVTKTKDGRATLTLTENATQYGSTYTPIATRRGNTVTLRMVVSRNGNDSGVITTLPVDMRPVDGITSTILASDGTSSDLVIRLNGEVEILTKNKTYRISLTYVVD
ncbi:BppU family phage baseplate upper protein [Bacillus cereus group sp. TH225LC]|uniref:BppU family phage baseplate upper protein n=1 Tax=Bacillus cereus group sp. TH225LC TaxID=3018050 RepID=UPI0022E5161F|nr:BppU family phage baseplate upper protein [Bacillus cereus group sp. TH225LC]MDA1590428.1 BppU family phage baseplate upper protein [Bacillus cereus group sp. TH225LC]